MTALAKPLAALVRALREFGCGGDDLGLPARRRGAPGRPGSPRRRRAARAAPATRAPSAARRRCRRRTCGSACAARPAGPAWSPTCWRRWAIRPDSRRVRWRRRRRRPAPRASCSASARSAVSSVASSADFACADRVGGRDAVGVGGSSSSAPDSAARAVCAASRNASSSDSRRMSATSASSSPGCGSTASISLSANFSRSASCASSRARCVRSTRSRRASASRRAASRYRSQLRLDVGEAVQRRALLVGAHQPQLVVLAVQGQQFGGEACSATSRARCGRRGRPATGRRG